MQNTYRSARAEMSVDNVAIYILLRWSKEGFRFDRCMLFGNISNELTFYINSRLKKLSKL